MKVRLAVFAGAQPRHRAELLRSWHPPCDGPGAGPRLRVVRDPWEPSAQLDSGRQLSLLIKHGTDRGGISLGNDEHPNSMAGRTAADKHVLPTKEQSDKRRRRPPVAKLGHGNFIILSMYIYETGGHNWFGLSAVTGLGDNIASTATIPVAQANNIDQKIDDGVPTSGIVQAVYIHNSRVTTSTTLSANPDTVSSCYNNSTNTYSTNVSNGSGLNCALSFKMQGAAR
jgi:hypothetical protein